MFGEGNDMNSLLSEKKNTAYTSMERHDFRESLCYYLSIIVILVTFIMSCVSLGLCSTSTIMDKIYSYEFRYLSDFNTFPDGLPVSLDKQGFLWPGAGLTIYLNSTVEPIQDNMDGRFVKIRQLEDDLTVVAYTGGLTIFKATCHGKTLTVSSISIIGTDMKPFKTRDLVQLSRNRYIAVSMTEFIPIEINVVRSGDSIITTIIPGLALKLETEDDRFPHIDSLTEEDFCLSYERGLKVYTRVGKLSGRGASAKLELFEEFELHTRLNFHGVAGLDKKHYLVTATGAVYNSTSSWHSIRTWLCKVDSNNKVSCGDHLILPWTMSDNWFAMDNFDSRRVLMVFADEISNGIHAQLINFDNVTETISYGSQTVIQRGGAILNYERMDLAVLDNQRFTVTYEDAGTGGLVLVMGTRTYSNDLVVASPNYVLSTSRRNENVKFYFDVCAIGKEHFAVVEVREDGVFRSARLHLGAAYSRVFGITKKAGKPTKEKFEGYTVGKVMVQMGGIVTLSGKQKLIPGRSVFTNSKGDLVQGDSFGYVSRDFGNFYTRDRVNNAIIDSRNLLGVAVTSKKIMLMRQ